MWAIFREKHLCWFLFLVKLQPCNALTLLLIESNTGVFPLILQNFYTQLFSYRTPSVKDMFETCQNLKNEEQNEE